MPIDLKEYERLQKKTDQLKSEADRARGALQQILDRLRDEHGCRSIEEAKAELKKLETKRKGLERKYEIERKKFDEEWADLLEEKDEQDNQG
jgi:hypothetical protein